MTFNNDGSLSIDVTIGAKENPHWMREQHTQHRQKSNVLAEIINNNILINFFMET